MNDSPGETGAEQACGNERESWFVVGAHDLRAAHKEHRAEKHGWEQTEEEAQGAELRWPAVLLPDSEPMGGRNPERSGHEESAEGATGTDSADCDSRPPGPHPPAPESTASESPAARLCRHALRIAEAVPVRAIHWFLRPTGTLIAEAAHGPRTTAVLVGWVRHAAAPAAQPDPPRVLLLGVFATSRAATRIAELPGRERTRPADVTAAPAAEALRQAPALGASTSTASAHSTGALHATDLAVFSRWALPPGCPPPSPRLVVQPAPGVLARELVAQLAEAFQRSSPESGGRS